jgi:hypothetical protein
METARSANKKSAAKDAALSGRRGRPDRQDLPATTHWNIYPFATMVAAADTFLDISAIFAPIIPNAFTLSEATRNRTFANIFLLIARVAARGLRIVTLIAFAVAFVANPLFAFLAFFALITHFALVFFNNVPTIMGVMSGKRERAEFGLDIRGQLRKWGCGRGMRLQARDQ